MKRMLVALAALGLVSSAARTDWGGPGAPPPPQGQGPAPNFQIGGPNTLLGAGGPYNGVAPDCYGMNPRLKKMFRIASHKEPAQLPPSYYYPQMGYNQGGPAYNPYGYPYGAYGPAQGTLVFPHQTFIRSPRDYFMLDLNK